MKKGIKIMLAIAIFLIVVGIGFITGGYIMGATPFTHHMEYRNDQVQMPNHMQSNIDNNEQSKDDNNYIKNEVVDFSNITDIVVVTTNSDVKLQGGNASSAYFEKQCGKYRVQGTTLIIEDIKTDKKDHDISVMLPTHKLNSITITSIHGDVEITGLNVMNLAFESSGEGDLDFKEGSVAVINAKSTNGDIDIKASVTNTANLVATYGNVEVEAYGGEQNYTYQVHSGIGEAEVNNIEVGQGIQKGNGKVSLNIHTQYGEVNLKFYK